MSLSADHMEFYHIASSWLVGVPMLLRFLMGFGCLFFLCPLFACQVILKMEFIMKNLLVFEGLSPPAVQRCAE